VPGRLELGHRGSRCDGLSRPDLAGHDPDRRFGDEEADPGDRLAVTTVTVERGG
jgi:hypothetical protein